MNDDELLALAERFADPATEEGAAQKLLSSVPRTDFAAFFRHAQKALDRAAKATRPPDAPAWIGAGHALAAPEIKVKLAKLESEHRARAGN